MATQVADHQPSAVPAARFDEEALSPVSKLEAARRAAAAAQKKRIDEAVARMATKKDGQGKRKALDARLDGNSKSKVQKTVVDPVEKSPQQSISRRLMDRFQTDPEPEQENVNPTSDKVTRSISTQFVTRTTTVTTSNKEGSEIVVETSAKLDEVIAKTHGVAGEEEEVPVEDSKDDENLPSTAFHVKQLGLTDEKVDIYAPPDVQQQEIRKLRERAVFMPPQATATIATIETASESEADSDFSPEAESADESADSDSESLPDVDPAEAKELEEETVEFALSEAAKSAAARRNALKWFFVWVPLYVILLCVLLLGVLFLVDWSQERYEFCPVDAASSDDSETWLSCGAFVSAQSATKSFLREALERAQAFFQQ